MLYLSSIGLVRELYTPSVGAVAQFVVTPQARERLEETLNEKSKT